MLFKFASYLLGTNNGDESKPEQQPLGTDADAIPDTQPTSRTEETRSTLSEGDQLLADCPANSSDKQDLIEEDDYMYAEQLINCSKLKNSNYNLEAADLVKEDQLADQLEDDEDCEDEQWIYITPIKRKNEEKQCGGGDDEPFAARSDELEAANCILIGEKDASKADVPKQQPLDDPEAEKEHFNFFDYFNNKSSLATLNEEEQQCSPAKSSKLSPSSSSSASRKLTAHKVQQAAARGMEESWVIQPPECFLLPNTFTIEENPLENLYIENPALSVMASCKSVDKENSTSSLTNSSSLNNSTAKSSRVLVDRNLNASQTTDKPSVASRKSMRKRANSTRKANKKQNSKKSRGQAKSADLPTVSASVEQSAPVEPENEEAGQPKPVLDERQEKQLLAHYLALPDLRLVAASNPIASSSSGSTHHSTHHPHHHFISNNCVATFNASTNANVEHKKGSKSLRRNNKVKIRDNLSNRPFTLHRKLC